MKKLRPSTQYRKDYKRYRRNPVKIKKLFELLQLLQSESPIPDIHRLHKLTGDYTGCIECHIENDFLLIWCDPETDEIDLLRLGSHSELFGKGLKN